MDQTSQVAAIAVPIAAALGLVGLIAIPAMAIRQASRDALRIEREWVAIRAERRRADLNAAGTSAPTAPAAPTASAGTTATSATTATTAPAGTTATIGAQRQGSRTPVAG
jgi:hypothetical protein